VQALAETGSLDGAKVPLPVGATCSRARPARHGAGRSRRPHRSAREREKQVLQTAAVIGRNFAEPILARVGKLPEAELGAALRKARGAEFIYEEALFRRRNTSSSTRSLKKSPTTRYFTTDA